MGFNKKLMLAGLAVGVTAFMLYKASKKKEHEKLQHNPYSSAYPSTMSSYSHQQHSAPPPPPPKHNGGSHWGTALGGTALAGAGLAAYGAYQGHHQQQQQQQQQQLPPPSNPSSSTLAPPPSNNDPNVSWDSLRDWRHIANLLSTCVMDQFLYPFWTFDAVARLATQLAHSGALVSCAEAWQLSPFLAQDLVKLALFDVMFLLDDSASMRSEGHTRRNALSGILRRAADAAGRFDSDGMECVWMNSSIQKRIHNADQANRLSSECKYDGNATPMGHALETQILRPHVFSKLDSNTLTKPVLILIITDGRPTRHLEKNEKVVQVIKQVRQRFQVSRYGEDAVSFQFAAVGNDREAQEWLDSIDSHSEIGDLVDVCSDIRVESKQVEKATRIQLTEELYCLKILLGGIDSSYDASDENNSHGEAGRKRQKRQQSRDEKIRRFQVEAAEFQRQKDIALGGLSPVPSAGGHLPPLKPDNGLEGYSHNPGYANQTYPQQPQPQQQPQQQQGYYGHTYPSVSGGANQQPFPPYNTGTSGQPPYPPYNANTGLSGQPPYPPYAQQGPSSFPPYMNRDQQAPFPSYSQPPIQSSSPSPYPPPSSVYPSYQQPPPSFGSPNFPSFPATRPSGY